LTLIPPIFAVQDFAYRLTYQPGRYAANIHKVVGFSRSKLLQKPTTLRMQAKSSATSVHSVAKKMYSVLICVSSA